MTPASPFGAVEDSDDDEDWLADVDDSMSASVSVSTSDAQRVSWVDKEDGTRGARGFGGVEEEVVRTTSSARAMETTPGPFGTVTPDPSSSSWSPGVKEAETGLRDAFGAASPSASESARTPTAFGNADGGHTDGDGGFVEYAQGDLGALFGGGVGTDEDWMSPTSVVSPVVVQPEVADFPAIADKSPAAVTYATSGPFASPITTTSIPPRDDGVAFFSSFNQGEPEEPVSDMFGSSEPVSIAPPTAPEPAREEPRHIEATSAETLPEPTPVEPDVVQQTIAPPPMATTAVYEENVVHQQFYEERYPAASEYPQAEFPVVTAPPVEPEPELEPVPIAPAPAPAPAPATMPMPPPPPTEPSPPPSYTPAYSEPVVAETSAPPIFQAYSEENLNTMHSVSSSNSVSDMYHAVSNPSTPQRPTFMVPEPVVESPAYVQAAPVASPISSANVAPAYAVYQPVAPIASYKTHHTAYEATPSQQLEYAAYSEAPTSTPVQFDESERSPDGRPAHVAMCFGFGGQLIMSGPGYPGGRTARCTNIAPCSVSVRSMRAILAKGNVEAASYLRSMERFQGPMSGKRSADIVKMLDSALSEMEQTENDALLYRVLKVLLRYKGELSDGGDLMGDNRKSATAELAAVLKGDAQSATSGGWVSAGTAASPLNHTGGDERAVVQFEDLLMSGRRGEALKLAVDAKLWPQALLLAGHLGGNHHQETLAAMAKTTCKVGSPLHTLEMVMAGLAHELTETAAPNPHGAVGSPVESPVRELLPRWREHVAILCGNPANGSAFVLRALGDELWQRNDLFASHIAYIIAKERPIPYALNSRLCLLGADHRKYPRTYATPQAIQLTEMLESALVGGNSQAHMPSLLPYKLMHAIALADVGKLKQALAYVEAILKNVRTLDRHCQEVHVVRVGMLAAELEARLQNGLRGKGGKLAGAAAGAAKSLIGGFKGLLDRSVSSLFGDENELQRDQPPASHTPPPMTPPQQAYAHQQQQVHSQPAPVTHMQQPQSVASPVAPQQPQHQRTPSGNGLLRSMSNLFANAAPKPQPAAEPTTSQENVFYYDETRKMWLERGKEAPEAPEPVGPPPTRAEPSETTLATSGPPPLVAPSMHVKQGGIHSRYVDTFNHAPREGASTALEGNVLPQGFVPMAGNAGAPPSTTPGQFFIPSPSHSREPSLAESQSSYVSHSRNNSQDAGFYSYAAQTNPSSYPPPEPSASEPTSIPRPPDIDPTLLAPPAMAPTRLPPRDDATAQIVAEELTELNLR